MSSINAALLATTPGNLGQLHPFTGAGIYAIYYSGPETMYAPIATNNNLWPIYVGKADAAGARKGLVQATPDDKRLHGRLKDHAKSITAATNLDVNDFHYLALPLKEVFTSMAERMMISRYRPVWNVVSDGFGNHNQGATRRTQEQSLWDLLHPGRPWAALQTPVKRTTRLDAIDAITKHLTNTAAAHSPAPRTSLLTFN